MASGRDNLAGRIAARAAAAAALFFVAACWAVPPAAAAAVAAGEEGPTREYRLKAAFVYHFLQFTEWPADAFRDGEAPIVVAVVGDDPFDGALEQALRNKRVAGRAVELRHVPLVPDANANDGAGGGLDCHLLFVSAALAQQDVAEVLRQVRGAPVLTVSDAGPDFTEGGGVLRLLVEGNRVRFQVNLSAMRRQGLKLSAKLLRLARVYEEPTP